MIVAVLLILAGIAVGITGTLAAVALVGWNRHRHLRELLDWLGDDLDARKMADLRNDQRIHYMRGQLP